MLQQWNDWTTSYKKCLFKVLQPIWHHYACGWLFKFCYKIVPIVVCRQDKINFLGLVRDFLLIWFVYLRRKQYRCSKHKFRINFPQGRLLKELIPHWTHHRIPCASSMLKARVYVVDKSKPHIYGLFDCCLYTNGLKP